MCSYTWCKQTQYKTGDDAEFYVAMVHFMDEESKVAHRTKTVPSMDKPHPPCTHLRNTNRGCKWL